MPHPEKPSFEEIPNAHGGIRELYLFKPRTFHRQALRHILAFQVYGHAKRDLYIHSQQGTYCIPHEELRSYRRLSAKERNRKFDTVIQKMKRSNQIVIYEYEEKENSAPTAFDDFINTELPQLDDL